MSKYDCSKTLDYAHEKKRMCNSYEGCSLGCPLRGVGRFASCTSCSGDAYIEQKHIDIVQKWSDEHPEKTRKEAFLELFPRAELWDKIPENCYGSLIGDKNIICVNYVSCKDCWNQLYNGEFEASREEARKEHD